MDVEVEEVAKLLFSDGIPEAWKDNEEFSSYLLHLADFGVEKLSKEASHIREERSAILDQTKELAYSNYKTFIHTADCSRTIFKDFTSVEDHLEALSSSLPGLKKSVETFLNTSRNLSISRHHNSLTLTKHTQLLEILELPQLMDTCVRNGYYDEALEILAYVRRLEKKHADVPIIAGIVKEVQAGTRLMLSQLLAQLRSSLALPQCLKVIGLLRRLDVFTEPELRLKFLQARDSWFKSILKSIPKDDPHQHLTKVVEASRVHLFDIVTQYRAIFSDDDPRFSLGDPDVNQQAIFQGWILHKVNQFLVVVEQDLERGVGTNLESVLVQCMFFGQSFSRVGADFRNLLTPLFQKAALAQCVKDIRSANLKFDESLSSFSLMEAPQMAPLPALSDIQDKTRPPPALMEYPPLAHYTNGLVAAFNNLRLCCPLAVMCEVIILLEKSLTKVIAALVELHRLESGGFTAKEEVSFGRLCWVLANCLLPHVNTCLRLLFPLHYIATISGVSQTQLLKEKFGLLNVESLVGPIEHLLPKKEELPEEEIEVQNSVVSENLSEAETTSSALIDNNTDEATPSSVSFFLGDQETQDQISESSSQNEQSLQTRNENIQNSVINDQNSNVLDNPIQESDILKEYGPSNLTEGSSGNETASMLNVNNETGVEASLQESSSEDQEKISESSTSSLEVQDHAPKSEFDQNSIESDTNSNIQGTPNQVSHILQENDMSDVSEAETDSLTLSSLGEVPLQGQEIVKEQANELVEISLEDEAEPMATQLPEDSSSETQLSQ